MNKKLLTLLSMLCVATSVGAFASCGGGGSSASTNSPSASVETPAESSSKNTESTESVSESIESVESTESSDSVESSESEESLESTESVEPSESEESSESTESTEPSESTPPTSSANEVTAEQFLAAIAFEGVEQLSCQMEDKIVTAQGQQEVYSSIMSMQFDGNKTYCYTLQTYEDEIDEELCYFEKIDGNEYAYVPQEEIWLRVPYEAGEGIFLESLRENFSDMFPPMLDWNFASFTYQDGYYTWEEKSVPCSLKLQFEDGKLTKIEVVEEEDGEISFSTYTFSYEASVTLPTEWVDVGETPPTPPTPPQPTDEWWSYFVFENVTVDETSMAIIDTMKLVDNNKSQVSNGQILQTCKSSVEMDGELVTVDQYVMYFDGQNTYVDGILSTELDGVFENWTMLNALKIYESNFMETAEGVYEAEILTMTNGEEVVLWKNIKLVVVEGKLQSAKYDIEYGGTTIDYEYTFSNWGTTVIDYVPDGGEQTPSDPNWVSYFTFDNVTVDSWVITEYQDLGITFTTGDILQIDGDVWLITRPDYAGNKEYTYFDGVNGYTNGVQDEYAELLGRDYFLNAIEWFAWYESAFVETATGVFEASLITSGANGAYTDVRIEIVGEKIQSVCFNFSYVSDGTEDSNSYNTVESYTFSNWGTTVIDYVPDGGEQTPSDPNWVSYFVLDNVTGSFSAVTSYSDTDNDLEQSAVIYIDGEKYRHEQGEGVIYYDGTDTYINGELDNDAYVSGTYYRDAFWSFVEALANHEDAFEKVSEGVYFAGKIEYLNGHLENVSVSVVDGKVEHVFLVIVQTNELNTTRTDIEYHFSNWGTTVVNPQ